MPWFNVDDGFYDHPKVSALKMAPRGLWVTAGCYCQKHLTDGIISHRQVRQLGGTTAQIDALLKSGLWEKFNESGLVFYRFHDYLDYQRSRNRVETEREQNKKRQQKHRAARATTSENAEMSQRDSNVSHNAPSNPIPSHPLKERAQAADLPPHELTSEQINDPYQKHCVRHRTTAEPPPCVPCKNRREAIEAELDRREQEAETAEHQRRAGIRNCSTCDSAGYRYGLTKRGAVHYQVKCWHTDNDALEAEQCEQWFNENNKFPDLEEPA